MAVLFERRRAGVELVLVCEGDLTGRVTLPVGWTDRVPAAVGVRLSGAGLVELIRLVADLTHPPVPKRGVS